jgi:NADPH:quinone reductase
MKAVLVKEFDRPDEFVLADVAPRSPGPGEVAVTVKACGVNFLDGLTVKGKYQIKPPLPFIPGAEVSGVVCEVGAGVTGYSIGTRVMAVTGFGGWAEQVVAPITRVFLLPERMDFTSAAAFPIVYATSLHALKDRARLIAGETLLVLAAAGGVGLTAVELGKIMGARVIACASSAEKLSLCRAYGADAVVDYTAANWRDHVKELTGAKGVDVVFDPVGGPYSEPALRSLGFGGRHLVIGFAAGAIPNIPLNLLLLKVTAIIGVFWGAYASARPQDNAENMSTLLNWYRAGRLRPHVSGSFSLSQYREALDEVMSRRAKGKVVMVLD